MSNTQFTPTREKAKSWNSRQNFFIPSQAMDEFPSLADDKSSDSFYEAVLALQSHLAIDCDGFYGKATHAEMINCFGIDMDFIVVDGARTPIDTNDLFYVKDFTEDSTIDLHRFGNFSKRRSDINFMMIHHGGFDPKHLARVFSNTERKVSSHFGIGLDEDDNVIVCQYLDTKWKAWHGGSWNEGSIGIDICFQPDTKWNTRYGVDIIDNPSNCGPRRINKLPDSIVDALVQLVSQLNLIFLDCEDSTYAFEVDKVYTKEEFLSEGINVVGHHHARKTKWDVGYAWQRLMDAEQARREGLGEEEGYDVS